MTRINLNGKWNFKQADKEKMPVNIPGTVYSGLLENNIIDDPFFGDNADKIKDYSLYDYEFEKEFELDADCLAYENIELCADGLDTICDVFVNGVLVQSCNNMHKRYCFDVKELLKSKNIITVKFYSPLKYLEEKQKEKKLWSLYHCQDGYAQIRKAHCMFGWDWAPNLPDMGIHRDIYIKAYNEVRIEDIYVVQHHNREKNYVDLDITVFHTDANSEYENELVLTSPDGESLCVRNAIDTNKNKFSFRIDKPMYWWPNGFGEQPLYNAEVRILKDGEIVEKRDTAIGLREITVSTEKDEIGNEFTIVVNGRKIFTKGACYVPEDSIVTRNSYERTYKLLSAVKTANCNIVRIWGGGTYPPDYFFDICDRLGLMVWQDFMFACAIYDLSGEFLENICEEVRDNIKRIRNHPSLALWCGNNEIEDAWVYWDCIEDEYKGEKEKEEYINFFEKILPEIVKEYDPQTFYWPSSPSTTGSFDEPRDQTIGDVHDWEMLNDDNLEVESFHNKKYRFLSEFGSQTFPCIKTLKEFGGEEEQNIFSKSFEFHQKHNSTSASLMKHVFAEFRYPNGLESIAYATQLLQAFILKYTIEHFRGISPRCMGTIYWQLNDCWPAISWSSIDYFGRWKASHYFVKRVFEPILVTAQKIGDKVNIKLINDSFEEKSGVLSWKLCTAEGEVLRGDSLDCTAEAQSCKILQTIDISDILEGDGKYDTYFRVEFKTYDKVYQNDEIFVKNKHFEYVKPNISYTVEKIGDKTAIRLKSDILARYVELPLYDNVLSDNYFSLYPNEEKLIYIEDGKVLDEINEMTIKTVYDI